MNRAERIWSRLIVGALVASMTAAYILDDLRGIVLGGFFLLAVMIEDRWPVESARRP